MVRAGVRRGAGVVALLVAAGLVAGCAAEEPVASAPPSPAYVSDYEAPEATQVAPLRGTTVPAGSLDHAAVSAKIDNHWDARPQTGLERTDIVFEELVEGGITRYVAVWHSDVPDLLGPIRSIRPMDPEIASPLGGIIFYSGGQPRFIQMMEASPVHNAIHGYGEADSYMFRANDRRAPHNVMVRAAEYLDAHPEIAAPTQQFAFALDAASSTAAKEGAPTASVQLAFSNQFVPMWTWDAASDRFLRSQGGAPDVDGNGDQLSAVNVVSLHVPITHGYGLPKTELIGSGEAWVSSGGATVSATWSKASMEAPITLTDAHGVTVRLAAGNTWVELVPTTGAVTVTPAG